MNISPYWVIFAVTVVGLVVELYAETAQGWSGRRWLVVISLFGICFPAAALVALWPGVLSGLVALVGVYRVVNMLRLTQDRWTEQYLQHQARRSSITLVVVQLLLVGVLALVVGRNVHVQYEIVLRVLAVVQVAAAMMLLSSTIRTLRKSQPAAVTNQLADADLPTVSVCIPARNETADLPECLQSIIANDYPKLEVLVFDDCSHDRTPEVIKGFAHDGVRFIGGEEPKKGWLGKNQAYETLYEQSEGEILLFCGVDVRLASTTIRALVEAMLARKKDMASVMPRRRGGGLRAVIIQPMRYWWEVALPRRTFNRPPVLSTLWAIQRPALKRLGGFKAVKGKIVPEAYFARELIRQDAYSFLRSQPAGQEGMQLETVKNWDEQYQTGLRMRYPQVKRRPELILLLSVAALALLVGPFVLAIGGFWWHIPLAQAVAAGAALLLLITHAFVVRATNPDNVIFAVLNFPVAALADIYIGNASMLKYEFTEMDWKGRNVCLPVLQAIPKLPKL